GKVQTAQGEVVEIEGRELASGRCLVSVVLGEGKHCLEGVWFNQPYVAAKFRYGQRLAFSGKPKRFRDHWQMTNPRVQKLHEPPDTDSSKIVPVYPLTEDLRPEHLQKALRPAVAQFAGYVPEILPAQVRTRRRLPEMRQALHDVHFPKTLAEAL